MSRWMTDKTKNILKERSKLTELFYRNGQRKSDGDKVLEKPAECTRILGAKKQYHLKMTRKLENLPKTHWTIIHHLLYNKSIRRDYLIGILFQILKRKLIFFTIILHQYVHL